MTTYYLGHTAAGQPVVRQSKHDYSYTHAAVAPTYAHGQTPLPSFSTNAKGAAKNFAATHGKQAACEVVEVAVVDKAAFEAATMTATEALNADIADAQGDGPKVYSNKSNAIRAFRSAHPAVAKDLDNGEIVTLGYVDEDQPGQWVVNDPDPVEDDFEASAEELAKQKTRPSVEQARNAEQDALYEQQMAAKAKPAVSFGNDAKADTPPSAAPKPKGTRAPSGTSNGLKIEADRPEQNGVKRPSAGGKCRGIWDMLDGIGRAATAKEAREAGAGKFDKTTIMVQFYKWRKFNGIEGRQA